MSATTANSTVELIDIYWSEIRDNAPLGRVEERDLFILAKAGDNQAMEKIIEANLRFVVRIARQYWRAGGPQLIDLVSEGNMGLIQAVQRFDEGLGNKFITYAVWWIRQAIIKCVAAHRSAARTPMNQFNDMIKVDKHAARLSQQLGRAPSLKEISTSAEMSEERVLHAMQMNTPDVSLDAPLSDDENTSLLALYSADEAVEENFEEQRTREMLRHCLEVLDEREDHIVQMYFGLDYDEPKTLQTIGDEMGLTRERVRQLRNRALQKLRARYEEMNLEPVLEQ